jgi:hypothetical protein
MFLPEGAGWNPLDIKINSVFTRPIRPRFARRETETLARRARRDILVLRPLVPKRNSFHRCEGFVIFNPPVVI